MQQPHTPAGIEWFKQSYQWLTSICTEKLQKSASECVLTHPGKCHPDGSISSSSHSHPHRRGPLGARSSPQDSDPAPTRHRVLWGPGKAAGVCVDFQLHSAPGWRWNSPVLWSSPSQMRSPAGWPELFLSYLEGFGRPQESIWWYRDMLLHPTVRHPCRWKVGWILFF